MKTHVITFPDTTLPRRRWSSITGFWCTCSQMKSRSHYVTLMALKKTECLSKANFKRTSAVLHQRLQTDSALLLPTAKNSQASRKHEKGIAQNLSWLKTKLGGRWRFLIHEATSVWEKCKCSQRFWQHSQKFWHQDSFRSVSKTSTSHTELGLSTLFFGVCS